MSTKATEAPPRPTQLVLLTQQCLQDSDRWFGDQMNYHTLRGLIHHALSLAGEAGEFANVVKKIDRGSLQWADAAVRHKLAMELTDVFVYTLNLAGLIGIDLGRTYETVRKNNDIRFTEQRRQREAIKAEQNGHV